MPDSPTKDAARDVLLSLHAEALTSISDPLARRALNETLISAIFDSAWAHQLDEDDTAFHYAARDLVNDAIQSVLPEVPR